MVRAGVKHRSYEMIHCCAKRDGHVVGGISKLLKAFIRQHKPDDIITVVDREWGSADKSWHALGFETGESPPRGSRDRQQAAGSRQ